MELPFLRSGRTTACIVIVQKGESEMKKDRKNSVIKTDLNQALSKRQGRRRFLLKTGGLLAAGLQEEPATTLALRQGLIQVSLDDRILAIFFHLALPLLHDHDTGCRPPAS